MSVRVGIVIGGGDCPGLDAVIRAVAKARAVLLASSSSGSTHGSHAVRWGPGKVDWE